MLNEVNKLVQWLSQDTEEGMEKVLVSYKTGLLSENF